MSDIPISPTTIDEALEDLEAHLEHCIEYLEEASSQSSLIIADRAIYKEQSRSLVGALFALREVVNKINEIIGYLKDNKTILTLGTRPEELE